MAFFEMKVQYIENDNGAIKLKLFMVICLDAQLMSRYGNREG